MSIDKSKLFIFPIAFRDSEDLILGTAEQKEWKRNSAMTTEVNISEIIGATQSHNFIVDGLSISDLVVTAGSCCIDGYIVILNADTEFIAPSEASVGDKLVLQIKYRTDYSGAVGIDAKLAKLSKIDNSVLVELVVVTSATSLEKNQLEIATKIDTDWVQSTTIGSSDRVQTLKWFGQDIGVTQKSKDNLSEGSKYLLDTYLSYLRYNAIVDDGDYDGVSSVNGAITV